MKSFVFAFLLVLLAAVICSEAATVEGEGDRNYGDAALAEVVQKNNLSCDNVYNFCYKSNPENDEITKYACKLILDDYLKC